MKRSLAITGLIFYGIVVGWFNSVGDLPSREEGNPVVRTRYLRSPVFILTVRLETTLVACSPKG